MTPPVFIRPTKTKTKVVAIIGAGPAGMAAALQLHRYGIKTMVFEQSRTGSLLKNAWCVENYLGIYPGKTGINVLRRFREVLAKNDIKILNSKVELLDYDAKPHLFRVKTRAKNYLTDYAIIATGTTHKTLAVFEKAPKIIKPYLFYEVFPLLKKRHKTVVIVGAGDAAFDNALNLAQYNKVVICNRSNNTTALPLLVTKALKHQNITYCQNYELKSISSGLVKNLNCLFVDRCKQVSIAADYLITAIGRVPLKDFYTGKLQSVESKLIRLKKLFLTGDIKNSIYRQVAIAVSDGIVAAMHIFHDLVRKNNVRNCRQNWR